MLSSKIGKIRDRRLVKLFMLKEKFNNFETIASKNLNSAIENWRTYIKHEQLLSMNTTKAYESDLYQFINFIHIARITPRMNNQQSFRFTCNFFF